MPYKVYYTMLCFAVLCYAVLCCAVLCVENIGLTSSSSSPLLFITQGADKQTGHAEGRDNQLSKLEGIFQRFDVDGSNGLSAGELRNGLSEECGLRLGDEDFQRLLNVVDSDHNGTLTV